MHAGGEVAASPEAAVQRMRKRVYALSSEVAHLTRERDMLRIQFGQQPGPTLPAGRYQHASYYTVHCLTVCYSILHCMTVLYTA